MSQEKIKTDEEHRYNLFNGFTIAIQIAGILKFLEIIRIAVLENKIYSIDLWILFILVVTAIGEEVITKTLFVKKRDKPLLSKRERLIVLILLILFIGLFIVLSILISPFLSSSK